MPVERLLWQKPAPGLRVAIAIPVRDEADDLPHCLAALAGQTGVAAETYEVVLLLNGCADGSEAEALAAAARHPALALTVLRAELPHAHRHVGWARRLAMEEACRRLEAAGHPGSVIATTDADTCAAPDWVAATLAEINAGADLVAGDIQVDIDGLVQSAPELARLLRLDRRHNLLRADLEALLVPDPHDPAPRHAHQTGASLALRVTLYRLVGGLPPLPNREDLALVEAIRAAGRAIRHSLDVRVTTSARDLGRTSGGMAATLRRWQARRDLGLPVHAETARSIEQRLAARIRGEAMPAPRRIEIGRAILGLETRIADINRRRAHPADRTRPDAIGEALEYPLSP